MAIDWSITLSVVIPITLTLAHFTIKYFRSSRLKFNGNSKSKNGNPMVSQVGSVGDYNNIYNTGSITLVTTTPKFSETEKREARKAITDAFKSFFFTFLGNNETKGMLNHPPHLDKKSPKVFASHYAQIARDTTQNAKSKLETAINTHALKLEDPNAEKRLLALYKKIANLKDVFEITEDLRDEFLSDINDILDNS